MRLTHADHDEPKVVDPPLVSQAAWSRGLESIPGLGPGPPVLALIQPLPRCGKSDLAERRASRRDGWTAETVGQDDVPSTIYQSLKCQ